MSKCGEVKKPDGWVCMVEGMHTHHLARVGAVIEPWLNEDNRFAVQEANKVTLGTIIEGAEPPSTAEFNNAHVPGAVHGTGIPSGAETHWRDTKGVWIEQAYATLVQFLKDHPEPFTTPEHLWPLLPCPHFGTTVCERRPLALVVQRALKAQVMSEVGGKRLGDMYHTADGHQFPMNKLVPVYQRT